MASLPAPDTVLSERLVLCETRLSDDVECERSSALSQTSVCDVLQLAARKAVGCAVGDVVVEGNCSASACEMYRLLHWFPQ
jgi:hypothetical protein